MKVRILFKREVSSYHDNSSNSLFLLAAYHLIASGG